MENLGMDGIAKEIGISYATIYYWSEEHGIEAHALSELCQYENGISIPSEEKLYDMYWIKKMSLREIAEIYGVNHSAIDNWMKTYGIETRTLSESQLNGNFTGERSGDWRGGISGGKYCYKFNSKFKEAVRKRDDYTCQLCGFEQNRKKLSVHHIHYDKENCYPDVVTLCQSCNAKVNSNRDYWESYFENHLIERGLYCWSISQSKET